MASPQYSYPPGMIAALIRNILLLRKRDFHQEAKACIARLIPPLDVIGSKNIPGHGLCVVTVNHYHRQGFGAPWFALAISALVPVNMHWVMTGEYTYPGLWYESLGTMWGNRGVIIDVGSSTFCLIVLKLSSKVISLLLLFVREPRWRPRFSHLKSTQ
jgi:hypothetical protein